jgi:hypothetical protein
LPVAVMLFKNTEEVKVLTSELASCLSATPATRSDNGFDCILRLT